jgi:hypothetical protein
MEKQGKRGKPRGTGALKRCALAGLEEKLRPRGQPREAAGAARCSLLTEAELSVDRCLDGGSLLGAADGWRCGRRWEPGRRTRRPTRRRAEC